MTQHSPYCCSKKTFFSILKSNQYSRKSFGLSKLHFKLSEKTMVSIIFFIYWTFSLADSSRASMHLGSNQSYIWVLNACHFLVLKFLGEQGNKKQQYSGHLYCAGRNCALLAVGCHVTTILREWFWDSFNSIILFIFLWAVNIFSGCNAKPAELFSDFASKELSCMQSFDIGTLLSSQSSILFCLMKYGMGRHLAI